MDVGLFIDKRRKVSYNTNIQKDDAKKTHKEAFTMAERWIVRAADEDFVEKECFDNFDDAVKYADKMIEIFGAWNVDCYREV